MIHKNLSWRLERLEQSMTPTIVRRVWGCVILHPDARHEKVKEIVWPAPRPAYSFPREGTAFRSRYR